MGSRMLKRWLHMPVRDTDTLVVVSRPLPRWDPTPNCSLCRVRWAILGVFWLAWHCARRGLATLRMRHAFQQLPELRAQLSDVDSAVQKLRETMGEFAELRDLLERYHDAPPVLVRDGGVIAWLQRRAG